MTCLSQTLNQLSHSSERAQALQLDLGSNPDFATQQLCDLSHSLYQPRTQ